MKRKFFFSQNDLSCVHVQLCFVLSLFLLSGSKPAYVISVVQVVLFLRFSFILKGEIVFKNILKRIKTTAIGVQAYELGLMLQAHLYQDDQHHEGVYDQPYDPAKRKEKKRFSFFFKFKVICLKVFPISSTQIPNWTQ